MYPFYHSISFCKNKNRLFAKNKGTNYRGTTLILLFAKRALIRTNNGACRQPLLRAAYVRGCRSKGNFCNGLLLDSHLHELSENKGHYILSFFHAFAYHKIL